jgi:hypothetical protein
MGCATASNFRLKRPCDPIHWSERLLPSAPRTCRHHRARSSAGQLWRKGELDGVRQFADHHGSWCRIVAQRAQPGLYPIEIQPLRKTVRSPTTHGRQQVRPHRSRDRAEKGRPIIAGCLRAAGRRLPGQHWHCSIRRRRRSDEATPTPVAGSGRCTRPDIVRDNPGAPALPPRMVRPVSLR